MKKKCGKSSQDLAKMIPTLIEQMLYLGISFANQSSICLLCCYVFNTKQLSCRNIISSSGLPKAFFSPMKTGSLHKSLLVCTGSPQAPILNYDRLRLRSHPLWAYASLRKCWSGNLQVSWRWSQTNNCRVADNS